MKGIEVDIQLKPNAKLVQQKGRPIPIHLQPAVGKQIEKLTKKGHIDELPILTKKLPILTKTALSAQPLSQSKKTKR